jgi:hypothetical protein
MTASIGESQIGYAPILASGDEQKKAKIAANIIPGAQDHFPVKRLSFFVTITILLSFSQFHSQVDFQYFCCFWRGGICTSTSVGRGSPDGCPGTVCDSAGATSGKAVGVRPR